MKFVPLKGSPPIPAGKVSKMALLEVLDNCCKTDTQHRSCLHFVYSSESTMRIETVQKRSVLNIASYLYKEIAQDQPLLFDEQLHMLEFLILKQYL